MAGCHYLHQLFGDALTRDDFYAMRIARYGFECLGIDVELELGGEAHCAHHAQRVVAECDVGVEWRAYDFALKIPNAVKWVEQLAKRRQVVR